MPTQFKALSELLEKVEATKKRLEIIDLVANYLKNLNPDEIEASTNIPTFTLSRFGSLLDQEMSCEALT